mgnify:CR=1 FL=1
MKKIIIINLTLLGLALPVSAADVASELAVCAQTKDSLARLVCYDKLAERSAGNKAQLENKQKVKDVAPVAAKKALSKEESFGGKHLKKKESSEVLKELEAKVKTLTKTLRGALKLTLENGQVWQQVDTNVAPKISAGDSIVVRRGALSSFYLKKADSNRTIRVKRIK